MMLIISPSKTLDYQTPLKTESFSLPQLLNKTQQLISVCKKLTSNDLSELMSISPKLAELNYQRFQDWQPDFNLTNSRQAILAFKGDVYEGLSVDDFNAEDFEFAQSHLRILSGLYGILRPLDLIQPYRLEMGIRLKCDNNPNLYQFWDSVLTENLNSNLENGNSEILINLASNEYFKAIYQKQLSATVITPTFLELRQGEPKLISFYAKKARGLMARYIIKNKITSSEQIKDFKESGYHFDKNLSTEMNWVFIREQ